MGVRPPPPTAGRRMQRRAVSWRAVSVREEPVNWDFVLSEESSLLSVTGSSDGIRQMCDTI